MCSLVLTVTGHRKHCFWWAWFQWSSLTLLLWFSKSRIKKVCGFSDPQKETEILSQWATQNLLGSLFHPSGLRLSSISISLINLPAECSSKLSPWEWVGEVDIKEGLSLRMLGPAVKLRTTSRWCPNLFPFQNSNVQSGWVKWSELLAGETIRMRESKDALSNKQGNSGVHRKLGLCFQPS